MERHEQLADALEAVARVNHYMVGIVGDHCADEIDAAEQLLIDRQNSVANAMPASREESRYMDLELALDLVEALRKAQ